ncbi:vacuolar protein sorting-associated protein 9A-like [Dorcoceras hygrometricum]|uniref:Vacuolar protein sorting-associated protein 9A-like n=1 Tax=Dorcoceras hygrometricum TaxID=472368 RepID=A0A2Z7AMF8_9LAMI|nr:vacuolar protein sorting-associated protein 9A-like [Dorcoceras hygrometricum]
MLSTDDSDSIWPENQLEQDSVRHTQGDGYKIFEASQGVCCLELCSIEGCSRFDSGRAKTFPPLKILTVKTVGTYVAKNKNITADETTDEPMVEKTVVKKATAKRRPAPAIVESVAKKKRTTVGREDPVEKNLAIVTVAQDVEPISVIPAASPKVQQHRAPKRKLVLQDESEEETVEGIIEQVIDETAELETDLEEPVVMETAGTGPVETESRIDVSAITNEKEPLVETKKEKEKDTAPVADKGMSFEKITDFEDAEPLSKLPELTETSTSDE